MPAWHDWQEGAFCCRDPACTAHYQGLVCTSAAAADGMAAAVLLSANPVHVVFGLPSGTGLHMSTLTGFLFLCSFSVCQYCQQQQQVLLVCAGVLLLLRGAALRCIACMHASGSGTACVLYPASISSNSSSTAASRLGRLCRLSSCRLCRSFCKDTLLLMK